MVQQPQSDASDSTLPTSLHSPIFDPEAERRRALNDKYKRKSQLISEQRNHQNPLAKNNIFNASKGKAINHRPLPHPEVSNLDAHQASEPGTSAHVSTPAVKPSKPRTVIQKLTDSLKVGKIKDNAKLKGYSKVIKRAIDARALAAKERLGLSAGPKLIQKKASAKRVEPTNQHETPTVPTPPQSPKRKLWANPTYPTFCGCNRPCKDDTDFCVRCGNLVKETDSDCSSRNQEFCECEFPLNDVDIAFCENDDCQRPIKPEKLNNVPGKPPIPPRVNPPKPPPRPGRPSDPQVNAATESHVPKKWDASINQEESRAYGSSPVSEEGAFRNSRDITQPKPADVQSAERRQLLIRNKKSHNIKLPKDVPLGKNRIAARRG